MQTFNFKKISRTNILFGASFVLAAAIVFFGGFNEQESENIINLVVTLSVTMGGFGLVAFQIANASNVLRNDFLESSILMILATISGFFFLVYPQKTLFGTNFGEISIFIFFWAFILFFIVLIDKRFNIIR